MAGVSPLMVIEIHPFRVEHIDAVKAFNARLAQGGSDYHFSEAPAVGWLPKRGGGQLRKEYFIAVDGDTVRGAYILKPQSFVIRGEEVTISDLRLPLSEGVIDPRFAILGMQMIKHAMKRCPMIFGLGMGGSQTPIARLLKALKWRLVPCPFFFLAVHPTRFLKKIEFLRRDPRRRLLLDLLAFTGAGWLGVHLVQAYNRRVQGGLAGLDSKVKPDFSDWADAIWDRVREGSHLIAVRDATTLNSLYPRGDERFIRLQVERHGEPIGWAVLLDTQMDGHRQFGNLRVGTVVDGLAVPGEQAAVVAIATRTLARRGVDLIVTNQLHRDWCAAFTRNGYLSGPSNFVFACSPALADRLEPFDTNAGLIHMTRGDGDGPINL